MANVSGRISRRRLLAQAGAVGAGLAASPLTGSWRASAQDERVTLTFWNTLFVEQDETIPKDEWFITQVVNQFQTENPDIAIDVIRQASDIATYDQVLQAANIARNGPDALTHFAGGPIISFADSLEPLDQYFTEEERAPILGWDAVREDFRPDGKIVAIPYGAGSYFEVMYNRELMGKAGIDVDAFTPPDSWEAFLDLAQQIKDAGVLPIAIGEQEGYTGAWVISTLAGGQLGTQGFFDMRAGKLPFNDPAMVEAYEQYRQPFARGLVNEDAGSLKNSEGQQLFIAGEGAMFIQGGWFNKDAYSAMGDNVDNFPIPTLAEAPHAGAIAGGPNVAVAVTNYSPHIEQGVKFLKFLLQPEIIDLYVKIEQVEPSNHRDADPSVIENPLLKNQAEWLKTRDTIYPFDNIMQQNINDLFYRVNASVFTGRSTPQEATDQLQNEFETTHGQS